MMKRFEAVAAFVLLTGAMATCARGRTSAVVRIDPGAEGAAISADFCGLSFETSNLLPDKQGNYLFDGDNADLIRLFKTIGVRNLRIGGGTADLPQYRVPGPADLDHRPPYPCAMRRLAGFPFTPRRPNFDSHAHPRTRH